MEAKVHPVTFNALSIKYFRHLITPSHLAMHNNKECTLAVTQY